MAIANTTDMVQIKNINLNLLILRSVYTGIYGKN